MARRNRLFFTLAFGVVGILLIVTAMLHQQRGGIVIMESVPARYVWSDGYFLNRDGSAFFRSVMVVMGSGLLFLACLLWRTYSRDIIVLQDPESYEAEDGEGRE